MYNKLLERQLKRNLKIDAVPAELNDFLKVINQSYEHYERDHILNQHSLKISSRELAEKEKRIRSIIDAASDGIIVMDSRGKIETCNKAITDLFQKAENEILSHYIEQFLKSEDQKEDHLTLKKLLDGIALDKEFFVKRPDGTEIPLEINISQSEISNEIVHVMVLRDVSRKKMREQEILKLHEELIIASRFAGMGEVANLLLHNIGNILNSIKVSISILIEKNKEHRVEEISKIVGLLQNNFENLDSFLKKDSVGRLIPDYLTEYVKNITIEASFTDNELELLNSRVQHITDIILTQQSLGKIHTFVEEIDVNKLVDEALKFGFIEKLKIPVIKEYGTIFTIKSDRVKLMQILVNIIKNAIEAMVSFDSSNSLLRIKTYAINDEHVGIEITDTGSGIPPEHLSKLFTMGFTTKKEGHGLGLHSCALLIQNIGGNIRADSKGKGKGSTFYLTLPRENNNS